MKTTDQLKTDLVRALMKWAASYEERVARRARKALLKSLGLRG